MPLGIDCPSCQHKFMIPDKMGGRPVKCPRCERGFNAPNGAADPPPPVAVPAPPPGVAPSPLAQSVALSSIARPAPRRGLTRLVLDIPEAVVRTVPKPLQGITGLAAVGLVVGLAAWAVSTLTRLEVLAVALGALGALFGGVALTALVKRHERGFGLPLAAVLVNVQALAFATVAVFAQGPGEDDNPVRRPPANSAIAQLRQTLKDPDSEKRLNAAFAVGDLAHDLNKMVLELMAMVRDPEVRVRRAAAEALGLIGPQARMAYAALLEATREDSDELVRTQSQQAINKIGPPKVSDVAHLLATLDDAKSTRAMKVAAAQNLGLIGADARATAKENLEAALNNVDAAVRVNAAVALWRVTGRTGADPVLSQSVLEVLMAGLKDFDPGVRAQAAEGLWEMQAQARDAAGPLEAVLGDNDPLVRQRAVRALWAIGPPAKAQVPKLLETLRDKDAKVRVYAAKALWRIAYQKDGVPVLCDALKSPDVLLRQMAADGLKKICDEARANHIPFVEKDPKVKVSIASAVPSLIDALKDSDSDVRGLAALSLGLIGPDARVAVPMLVKQLRAATTDPGFRAEIAFALIGISEPSRDAVVALTDCLDDRDNTVRVFAARALYTLERKADAVVPTLINVLNDRLKDRDGTVRARAAFALGLVRTTDKNAIAALNDALKDANALLRMEAATALGKIGKDARVTYPTLDQLAKDDQPEVKKAAGEAKNKVGAPQRTDVPGLLIPALKHDRPSYRVAATVCLWMLNRDAQDAVEPLSELLTDPDEQVRAYVPIALAAIGPRAGKAVPALIKALQNNADDTLRYRAAYALGEIGGPAKEAVPALRTALKDKKALVRLHAAQALWAIDADAPDAVPVLAELLEDHELDAALLVAAIEMLTKIGPKSATDARLAELVRTRAVPALAVLVGHDDEYVQITAINALGAIGYEGREGVPRLIEMLGEADAKKRYLAIEALVKIGAAEREAKKGGVRAKVAFAQLVFLSTFDTNPQVAQAATLAMTKLTPAAEDVPDLLAVAGDPKQSAGFRHAAAHVLRHVGTEAKAHVEAMCKLLTTDDAGVRAHVAAALGAMEKHGKTAIAPLIGRLKDDEVFVRVAAVQALGELGLAFPEAVRPTLQAVAGDAAAADPVRAAAEEALKKLPPGK
jgi:HEAT repeat protein